MTAIAYYCKAWFVAARPHTLSASLVPIVVGSAFAAAEGKFAWHLFVLTLVGAVLVQIGANFTDEYADHGATASAHKYLAPHKVIARGLLSHTAVRLGAVAVFGAATLIGIWLVRHTGWPLLAVCLVSLAVAYAYSAGPLPLGDYALGEVLVFVIMGPVMVMATYYVQAGLFSWSTLWVALPVGALVSAILVVNNLRDEEEDRSHGRRTVATVFGAGPVWWGYQALLALAFATPLAALGVGERSAWLALPWLTLPLALRVAALVRRGRDRDTLHRALKGTSALHLLFGLALTAALIAPGAVAG
jgi:1,4-dihydroxy-2-naphthoate octaprenyltransferase